MPCDVAKHERWNRRTRRLRFEVLEQSTGSVALSSGEAEYYASVKAAAELIGLRSLASSLKNDRSSAKAITSRLGAGKVRHLEVRFPWLQQVTRNSQLQVVKVRGQANPADLLTKSNYSREACDLLSLVMVIDPSRECDWVEEVSGICDIFCMMMVVPAACVSLEGGAQLPMATIACGSQGPTWARERKQADEW